jgi:hypothetical protein
VVPSAFGGPGTGAAQSGTEAELDGLDLPPELREFLSRRST